MIKISIRNIGISYSVEIRGHAEYGESGKDIVCAGVSTIAYTMANYMKSSKAVSHPQIEDDGNFYMRCTLGNKKGKGIKKSREALRAIEKGFYLIEQEYPNYVRTEILTK